jgi:hemerythrin
MTVELDPVLLTGVDDIDAQHRELFERIGTVLEASRNKRSREEVIRTLEFPGSYVVHHFAAEERTMEHAGYPRIEAHRREHRQLVKEVEILRHELKSEGPSARFAIRVGNRITDTLREHIYRADRLMAEWLRHPR